MFSVEIVWKLGNSSVSEVFAGLQGAVGQHLVLPLSQNQQAITTCRHNLHTNMIINTMMAPSLLSSSDCLTQLVSVFLFYFIQDIKK